MKEKHEEKEIYDDYRLLSIKVDTLTKLRISEIIDSDSGEVTHSPYLSPSNLQSRLKKTDIILAPDGRVVYPQSLYLVSKLSGEGKIQDTTSLAKGLLAFTRYLDSTHYPQVDDNGSVIPPQYLTYKTLTKHEEEGAPWQFAEHLLANCRSRKEATGDEAYSLNSVRSYMGAVIGFYKWMQKYGYLKNDDEHVLTHFTKLEAYLDGTNQHDMLAHTKSGAKRVYEISNIMKVFPKIDKTPAHQKLKPMTFEHKERFSQHIHTLPKAASLILRLCEEAGLRIDEATHFPARYIGGSDFSGLDVVPLKITRTKGSKPRSIEIPIELYEELEQYKECDQRQKNLTRRNELIDAKEEQDTTEYLFLSNKGRSYAVKTLETHFSKLRQRIRAIWPSSGWYYRIHDLRSTYATYWLDRESKARQVKYNYLMDELATLMGHEDTAITEKYIKFMEKRDEQLKVAESKNNKINEGW
ncbi:Integrase [Vibrio crassostreae]|nr:Integrase [Vibrio crassostreae]CAK2889775.1 Integrase [Vibrio crassostreae]CAK2890409.1 Integrase [Vibrio crassostreae]CAK2892145.1 Integrase [Vibrio crassostreae]CAK2897421.1 Integrase [Vibrio crassostreae]